MKKLCLLTVLLLSGLLVSCASTGKSEKAVESEAVEEATEKSEPEMLKASTDEGLQEDSLREESAGSQGGTEASDDKEEEQQQEQKKQVTFEDFLHGSGDVIVADNFLWQGDMIDYSMKPGETYDMKSLKEFLEKNEFTEGTEPAITYAPITIHDQQLFSLKIYYQTDWEEVLNLFVIRETDENPEIIFAIDGWSRKRVSMNEYGIVTVFGSGGASIADHHMFAPDKSLAYHEVYNRHEQYYDISIESDIVDGTLDTMGKIMKESGLGNDKAKETVYYTEIINGKTYYYFLGTGKMSQSTVDYIDNVAAKYDFKFDGKAAADDAREAYIKELGIEGVYDNETEPKWTGI